MRPYLPCITVSEKPAYVVLTLLPVIGIAALPFFLLALPDIAEATYTLVSIAGLLCLLNCTPSKDEYNRIFLYSTLMLLFFLAAAISVIASGDYSGWFRPLKKLAEFLPAPFIAILLVRARIPAHYFIITAKISALLVFIIASCQFFILHNERPGGAISPLQFGHVSLLLGFFSLIMLPLENTLQRVWSLTSFGAGYLSTLISQTRIEWVNAFILMAALLLIWNKAKILNRQIMLTILGATLALSALSVDTPLIHRIGAAIAQYQTFKDQQSWEENAVGQRILMWQGGLKAAAEKPFFGWGIHRSQQAAVARLENLKMKETFIEYHNLHNEYINTLAAKGMIGLLSLLALLFVPLRLFYRSAAEPGQLVFSAAGALLCVSYAVSGLTYQAFGDDTMNIFFVIVLAYTLTAVTGTPQRSAASEP